MKWLKVLPTHIISLIAVAAIALGANTRFEWGKFWGFYLLILPVGIVLFRLFTKTKPPSGAAKLNAPTNQPEGVRQYLWFWVMEVPLSLRVFALGMIAIAIARPQSSDSVEDMTSEGIDLVLAMDVSVSMLSMDFSPNRIEQSKKVAEEFVEGRPHDRIGVVAYEGEAYTQVPVTTDHTVVKNGLRSLKPGLLEGGTAIGMGLATAVNRLRKSEAESKVIILLTDGMNNTGQIEPLDAAQLAELNDIRIYTIGVGTIGKAKSPVAIVGDKYKYDWVEVQIDEDVLRKIAESTDGKYFRATNAEKLAGIYREIDELEKTRFNVFKYQRKTEAFINFALLALLALAIEKVLKLTLLRSIS